jgi:hypothetical protein
MESYLSSPMTFLTFRGETFTFTRRSYGLNGEPDYVSYKPAQALLLDSDDAARSAVVIPQGPILALDWAQ